MWSNRLRIPLPPGEEAVVTGEGAKDTQEEMTSIVTQIVIAPRGEDTNIMLQGHSAK